MDLIYYHKGCTDGWAAAYIAHLKYPEAKLVPASYSTEPPYAEVKGKDVLMVDFAWKGREVNIILNSVAKSLLILDHHKSAEESLRGLDFVRFDMKRSGAGLAWDYLFGYEDFRFGEENPFGPVDLPSPRPWWVDYVEDYDIWTKKLPHIDQVSAFLHSTEKTIEAWRKITQLSFDVVTQLGSGAWQQIRYQTDQLVSAANSGGGWGLRVGIVNGPFFTTSEVGAELAKTHDVGIVWWVRKDGKMSFGLRSQGDIDVSKIALRYGGGGHKNSAGFEVSASEGYGLIKDILSAGANYGFGDTSRCVC